MKKYLVLGLALSLLLVVLAGCSGSKNPPAESVVSSLKAPSSLSQASSAVEASSVEEASSNKAEKATNYKVLAAVVYGTYTSDEGEVNDAGTNVVNVQLSFKDSQEAAQWEKKAELYDGDTAVAVRQIRGFSSITPDSTTLDILYTVAEMDDVSTLRLVLGEDAVDGFEKQESNS